MENDANSFRITCNSPRKNCPHLLSLNFKQISSCLESRNSKAPCADCWICLTCPTILCSGSSSSSISQHIKSTGHYLAKRLIEENGWCYQCNDHFYCEELHKIEDKLGLLKTRSTRNSLLKTSATMRGKTHQMHLDLTGLNNLQTRLSEVPSESVRIALTPVSKPPGESTSQNSIDSFVQVENPEVFPKQKHRENSYHQSFTREKLVRGLRSRSFRNIVFLLGSGISIAGELAKIQANKEGYQQLKGMKIGREENYAKLECFKKWPMLLYSLLKEQMNKEVKPTIVHSFMKRLSDLGMMSALFTKSIDGIELMAGIDHELVVEMQGNMRAAHCSKCGQAHSMNIVKDYVQKGKVYRCPKKKNCLFSCGGFVKPDILLTGEKLPELFFDNVTKIAQSDLVFVVGASLKENMLGMLVDMIPQKTPIVLINKENNMNSELERNNVLHLEGEPETQVRELLKDLEWLERMERIQKKIAMTLDNLK